MCFKSQPKTMTPAVLAQPEPVAEEQQIGEARKAEDQELFGGTPQLRTDRSAMGGGVASTGTGLRMM